MILQFKKFREGGASGEISLIFKSQSWKVWTQNGLVLKQAETKFYRHVRIVFSANQYERFRTVSYPRHEQSGNLRIAISGFGKNTI